MALIDKDKLIKKIRDIQWESKKSAIYYDKKSDFAKVWAHIQKILFCEELIRIINEMDSR